jgi:acyl carrier protein
VPPLIDEMRQLLGEVLGLKDRAALLTADTELLGSLPELDSMAVATVLAAIEERFGVTIDDSQMSAEIFTTLGHLTDFLATLLPARGTAA